MRKKIAQKDAIFVRRIRLVRGHPPVFNHPVAVKQRGFDVCVPNVHGEDHGLFSLQTSRLHGVLIRCAGQTGVFCPAKEAFIARKRPCCRSPLVRLASRPTRSFCAPFSCLIIVFSRYARWLALRSANTIGGQISAAAMASQGPAPPAVAPMAASTALLSMPHST